MALKQFAWIVAAGLLLAGTAVAQSSPQAGMSLDEAVTQVQQKVGGKVLSAEPRHIGRNKVEYRIKVLTPEGHVRVFRMPSDATRVPPAAQSPKKFPNGGSKKEKH
ncbi:hypothetical protein DWU98_06815 [Dyella monticola]|uniref:PepSY domain-containing protein n=1 Tax=Dyella monticola TaxID=1927958 RepID=A0A370X374_9GAMM|nr:hypothetical protein [Dyella monticola]RDS82849.1 hypothetical protein DWU98_06815 [Dyella monticola]